MMDLFVKWEMMKIRMAEALQDEKGMGTIEIAIIIIVLIGLALLFRTKIEAFLESIFGEMIAPAVSNSN